MSKRIIIGTKGGTVGMWVSVPGKDAETASAPEDFLINTTRNNLKPVMAGVIAQPSLPYISGASNPADYYIYNNVAYANPQNGYVTYYKDYNHNLGYIPICFFSVGSAIGGEVYPTIKIDSNKVRLYTRLNNDLFNNNYRDWNTAGTSNTPFMLKCGYPSSINYSCYIHYTFYKSSTGL